MPTLELKTMPLAAAVQVVRWRENAETGVSEPWPVATIDFDMAGKITFKGDASKAYEPLLRATQRAASKLAHQSVLEAVKEAQQIREDDQL
jgi:hypothetical protein